MRDEALRYHSGRGLEPGQQDRLVADRTAGLRGPAAAVQRRLPGRGEHPAVAATTPRRAGTRRPGSRSWQDNPLPAVMGRACYRPCETACNRAQLDRRSASTRSSASSATRPSGKAGTVPPAAAPTGKRVLVVGAGPGGPVGRLPARRLGPQVTIVDAGPHAGGMMRYGIPAYRLPREVLDAEIGRILAMGVTLRARATPSSDIRAEMRDGGFDAAFLAVGAQIGTGLHPRRRLRPHPRRRVRAASMAEAGAAAARPAGRGLRRRRHRHGRGANGATAGRDRRGHRLPAHPASGCRPTTSRSRRPLEEGIRDEVAVHHRARERRASSRSRRCASTSRASRSRPASSRNWTPTAWCSRSARRPTWPCWTGSRGSSSPTAWSRSART